MTRVQTLLGTNCHALLRAAVVSWLTGVDRCHEYIFHRQAKTNIEADPVRFPGAFLKSWRLDPKNE